MNDPAFEKFVEALLGEEKFLAAKEEGNFEKALELNNKQTGHEWVRFEVSATRSATLKKLAITAFGRDNVQEWDIPDRSDKKYLFIKNKYRTILVDELRQQSGLPLKVVLETEAADSFIQELLNTHEKTPLMLMDEIRKKHPEDKNRFSIQLEYRDEWLIGLAQEAFGDVVVNDIDSGGFGNAVYLSIGNAQLKKVHDAILRSMSYVQQSPEDPVAALKAWLTWMTEELLDDSEVPGELKVKMRNDAFVINTALNNIEHNRVPKQSKARLVDKSGDLLISLHLAKNEIEKKKGSGAGTSKPVAEDAEYMPSTLEWISDIIEILEVTRKKFNGPDAPEEGKKFVL